MRGQAVTQAKGCTQEGSAFHLVESTCRNMAIFPEKGSQSLQRVLIGTTSGPRFNKQACQGAGGEVVKGNFISLQPSWVLTANCLGRQACPGGWRKPGFTFPDL